MKKGVRYRRHSVEKARPYVKNRRPQEDLHIEGSVSLKTVVLFVLIMFVLVLFILYELGYLNGLLDFFVFSFVTPMMPAGSCFVYRPANPVILPDLAGNCTKVAPREVAVFNGQNSYINTSLSVVPVESQPRSAFAWIDYNGTSVGPYMVEVFGTDVHGEDSGIAVYNNSVCFWEGNACVGALRISSDRWYFVGYTFSSGSSSVVLYVDGQSEVSQLQWTPLNTVVTNSTIGVNGGGRCGLTCDYFKGAISNVQIYDDDLGGGQVAQLYGEGIGGAPVDIQSLVAWFPLNGNSEDYSGNANGGYAKNVNYTQGWIRDYSTACGLNQIINAFGEC